MIARIWHGWAPTKEAADAYEMFLRTKFLPEAHAIEGYRGATVLRRTVGNEEEFTTITRFESLDAIRRFAGDDAEAAHVAQYAQTLLPRFDARCEHIPIVIEDRVGGG